MSLLVRCDKTLPSGWWFFRTYRPCGMSQIVPSSRMDEGDRRGFLQLLGWTTLGRDEHYCPEHAPEGPKPFVLYPESAT